jgi:hypothetical protein
LLTVAGTPVENKALWQRPSSGAENSKATTMPEPTPRELRRLATEARATAEEMRTPWAKRTMLNIALHYERLALHVALCDQRETGRSQEPGSSSPLSGAIPVAAPCSSTLGIEIKQN